MGLGLHHIGVEVDSIDEVKVRYLKYDPQGLMLEEAGGIHYGTARIFDPECNPISLSESGFGLEKEESRIPRVRHIALNALVPDRVLSFYNEVLGLRELGTTLREDSRNSAIVLPEMDLRISRFIRFMTRKKATRLGLELITSDFLYRIYRVQLIG